MSFFTCLVCVRSKMRKFKHSIQYQKTRMMAPLAGVSRFVARLHAYARRARYCLWQIRPSVRLSVTESHWCWIKTNAHIVKLFPSSSSSSSSRISSVPITSGRGMTNFFECYRCYRISRGTRSLNVGIKYTEVGST